ncbi:MAG: DNA polymerase I [Gammaproteobacteria bacterium]
MSKRLILVDGSSYLYRAFHALPPFATSDGRPTGAVYGVLNMLRKLLREEPSSHIGVVFDAPGPTFRDELFERYKANRAPMPDDMRPQVEPLLIAIQALGLPLLRETGVEADDVIGTLAHEAADAGYDVVIVTGDKDMAQLVNDRITLLDTMRDRRLDSAGVEEKFGVPPTCIIDLLALMGDTSDNIPGVHGVGPKTAAKWLQDYGSLDELLAHADDIKGKAGERLRDSFDDIQLSRELATIKCDVKLDVEPAGLTAGEPDTEALRQIYADLEFKSWLAELGEAESAAPERDYEIVTTEAQLDAWIKRLEKSELFAVDTETTSLDYLMARIVGISFALAADDATYVPLAHTEAQPFDREAVLERLRPLLESAERGKVGHHLKYDAHVFANHGIKLAGIRHDTLLESYVLDPTAGRHDMDSLAERALNEKTIDYDEVTGTGRKRIGFEDVPIEAAGQYAAEDADITWRLHENLWPRLQALPRACEVYESIELPIVPVLLAMERHGVLIDCDQLAKQSAELEKRMAELQQAAWDCAGQEFNLSSPVQLGEILYDKLALPARHKTPKGQPSTAEKVLLELADEHELPKLILDYREVSKLRSTYTEKLPASVNPSTGRVHTSYNQTGTSTGRLSSSDPNLQNIPVRSEEGRRIRQAFIAPPGCVVLAADYSQVELRIMAHLSGDQGLRKAFAEKLDIHTATAAEVLGKKMDEVTAEERRAAKATNFGLIYGMSAFGLARQLGISRGEAEDYINRYFDRYPGVRHYMDSTREQARRDGYVETLFGRRLYVPEISSRNMQRRQGAERAAINAPMQGTAADIIKRAMITIHAWCARDAVPATLIMQVHDELVFEVEEKFVDTAREEIRRQMQDAADLSVPLVVDIGTGANWDEAH